MSYNIWKVFIKWSKDTSFNKIRFAIKFIKFLRLALYDFYV